MDSNTMVSFVYSTAETKNFQDDLSKILDKSEEELHKNPINGLFEKTPGKPRGNGKSIL
jgi:hypothetical protein